MKKNYYLFVILFTFLSFNVKAQTPQLWGMTNYGGTNNLGAIIKINTDGTGLDVPYSFGVVPNNSTGSHPQSDLYQASDGKLYGMTYDGGLYNFGTIFSFDINTNTFTRLFSFNDTTGANPMGALVEANNGKLYGMTSLGGAYRYGALFSFDFTTNTYTDVHDFDVLVQFGTYNAIGSLINCSDGNLYGLTCIGGTNNYGTVFSFNPTTNAFQQLASLNGTDGSLPFGSPMQASDGNLFFTTIGNSICSYSIPNHAITQRATNIGQPQKNLVQLSNGFMITPSMDEIFVFNPANDSLDLLYYFPNDTLYGGGWGTFTLASDGTLYGLGRYGGLHQGGTIVNYNPATNTLTKLVDLKDSTGMNPYGDLIQATNGKLYGMTNQGGASNDGVIFCYDPVQNTYSKLFDFNYFYSTDGSSPTGDLLRASDGFLYGLTPTGGLNNAGSLFRFDANAYSLTKLYDFAPATGASPQGTLLQASDGNLYGMALLGGTDTGHYFNSLYGYNFPLAGSGVMFKYNISTNTYSVLHNFDDSTGALPWGNLMQSTNGKLYGMASIGGTHHAGVIFTYDINSGNYQVVHNFDSLNGLNPNGTLMEATDGKLYGMTLYGGIYCISQGDCSSYGVIFSLDTGTNNFHLLQYLNVLNAGQWQPFGNLIQVADGRLYGMTSGNYPYNDYHCNYGLGNIFSLDIPSNTLTNIYSFNGSDGLNPYGTLMKCSDGKLYGMTQFGGSNSAGVIFGLDTTNAVNYTVLHNFYFYNGGDPYGNLIEMPAGTGINQVNISNQINLTVYPNPFSDYTTFIIKGNSSDKNISLNIYDITGREVQNLFLIDKKEIKLDRNQLESGMYFYKLISGEKEIIASGKLIIN